MSKTDENKIFMATETMGNEIDLLNDTVGYLMTRLDPIMTPKTSDEASPGEGPVREPMSSFTINILEMVEGVSNARCKIQDVLGRLEV